MVLLIVTITYKLVLVVLGLLVMILRPEPVWELLKPIYGWCYLGIFLNVVCVFGMLILVFHPTLASRIVLFCVRLFDRMFKTDKEKKYGERLERAMEKYRNAAEFFYKNLLGFFRHFQCLFLMFHNPLILLHNLLKSILRIIFIISHI